MTIPKTLGACADRLFTLRAEASSIRKALDATALVKRLGKIAEEQKAIEEHLIENLPKSKADGIVGKLAKAIIKTSKVPTVTDWDKLYAHILKTRDFSLLPRKVLTESVRDRWEEKKVVPGVGVFNVTSVSITQR
jgi:hypothetical protein